MPPETDTRRHHHIHEEGHSSELSCAGRTKDGQGVIIGLTITVGEGEETDMPICPYAKEYFPNNV